MIKQKKFKCFCYDFNLMKYDILNMHKIWETIKICGKNNSNLSNNLVTEKMNKNLKQRKM